MRDIKRLICLLFRLEAEGEGEAQALYTACRDLLPPDLSKIWNTYEMGGDCGQQEDGYNLIFSVAMQHADDRQLLRCVELAKSQQPDMIFRMANQLMDEERWQAAFAAYSMVPEHAPCAREEFWYRTGRCLYHMREWDGAEECLKTALAMHPDYLPAKAFLQWTREARTQ